MLPPRTERPEPTVATPTTSRSSPILANLDSWRLPAPILPIPALSKYAVKEIVENSPNLKV